MDLSILNRTVKDIRGLLDCDGLQLIKHPGESDEQESLETFAGKPRRGWSNAAKYRRARRYGKRPGE